MKGDRAILGARGEEVASVYLKKHGYRILERNFRCPIGEIDIVAKQGKTLVFVEVRTKRDQSYGHPKESITARKQRKLARLAEFYLKKHRLSGVSARFDVVSVLISGDQNYQIELIKNAFEMPG